EDAVAPADGGGPLEHHMGADHGAGSDFHIRTYQGPGTNLDVIRQPRGRINDRQRVNSTHTLCSAQMISPEQASLPSTLARQANFQMPRRLLRSVASSGSGSPGTTG